MVQVYATFPDSHVAHRPQRRLVGFQRVELDPGESKAVAIPIRERELAYWDDATHTWQVEAGTVGIHISASSADDRLSGSFSLTAHPLGDTGEATAVSHPSPISHHPSSTTFDLAGRPVSCPAKGIYLVDGKKYIKQ